MGAGHYDKIVDDVLTDLESITAPIFRSLRNTDVDFTNIQDRYKFGKFICFLTFRTPQFQQHFDILVQNTVKTKFVEHFNEKGGPKAIVDEFHKRTGHYITPAEFIDSFNKIKIRPPDGSYPELLGESVKRMIPAFCSMKWHFLKSDSEMLFITSDAPVIMNDPNEKDPSIRYGYAKKGIQIICPINKRLCLLAGWTGKEGYYHVNKDVVKEMNSKIAEQAKKYLFSPIRYEMHVEENHN